MNGLDSCKHSKTRANFVAQSSNVHNDAIDKFAKSAIEMEGELIASETVVGFALSWAGIVAASRIVKNQHCRVRAVLAC